MDLNGEWVATLIGAEDKPSAIFQQGRFVLLVEYNKDASEANQIRIAVGIIEESHIHVPSWSMDGHIHHERLIDWGGSGRWRKL